MNRELQGICSTKVVSYSPNGENDIAYCLTDVK